MSIVRLFEAKTDAYSSSYFSGIGLLWLMLRVSLEERCVDLVYEIDLTSCVLLSMTRRNTLPRFWPFLRDEEEFVSKATRFLFFRLFAKSLERFRLR